MNIEEIKAREQAAAPGPWYNFGDWMIHTENDVEHCGVPGEKVIGTVNKNNAAFIAAARTDIPALIAEVERLTDEIVGLKANSMIQEHIISNGDNPIDKDKIVRLIMEKTQLELERDTLKKELSEANENHTDDFMRLESEIDTLKKALELACEDANKNRPFPQNYSPSDGETPFLKGTWQNYYIQQAQEQEGEK